MKARFAYWFFMSLGLGYLSEIFSKSLHPEKDVSLDLETVNWSTQGSRFSTTITTLTKITTVPNYLTGNTFGQISDKQVRWQTTDAQIYKDQIENVTVIENKKEDGKFQSKLSPIGDFVFGSLLLVSCILALLGNGCALTIFRFRQRTLIPMEVFFISLAVADILLSVASYPLAIIASFQHAWNFKELGCTMYAFSCYFLGLASIYTVTAMAYTRYLITCKPIQGNMITCWACFKMVVMGYLLAFLLAAMPLLGFGNYEVEPFGLSCTLDWISKDRASRIYIILVTIFCVLLPLFILVFCYSQIIIFVKQSNTLMKNTGVHKRNEKRSSGQLTLISGLISAGFVIAWFPYTIACLWTSFQGDLILPIWATPGPCLFAKLSIVYNPIIYVFLTERYRKDFYDLVQYITCKSGVIIKERRNNTRMVTVTDEDGSTFHHEMEEHSAETSNSDAPMFKETCV